MVNYITDAISNFILASFLTLLVYQSYIAFPPVAKQITDYAWFHICIREESVYNRLNNTLF